MKSYYLIESAGAELENARNDLEGYWKFLSILYLRKIGLPVLNGIIVTRWNEEVRSAIVTFCERHGWQALLLRHDKKPELPPYPMGGYLVAIADIQNELLKYFELGRIVFLMEPCSPFDNSYNINSLFEINQTMLLEIVGPGFDASDLQRGQISPHETVQIDRTMIKTGMPSSPQDFERSINRRVLTNRKSYEDNVRQRYIKIAKRLIGLGNILSSEKELHDNDLVVLAKKYLQDNNHTPLLLNETDYKPIPIEYLYELCTYIYKLPEKLQPYINQPLPFVISSSYVKKGAKLVFWDIVFPKLKYSI